MKYYSVNTVNFVTLTLGTKHNSRDKTHDQSLSYRIFFLKGQLLFTCNGIWLARSSQVLPITVGVHPRGHAIATKQHILFPHSKKRRTASFPPKVVEAPLFFFRRNPNSRRLLLAVAILRSAEYGKSATLLLAYLNPACVVSRTFYSVPNKLESNLELFAFLVSSYIFYSMALLCVFILK
jgi:hypothetical protein